jgi:hypothetical protein
MKKTGILLAFLFTCIFSICQTTVNYSYDSSGNRTDRYLQFKSTRIFNEGNTEEQTEEAFNDRLGDIGIIIYPNPVKGELLIKFENLPDEVKGRISVYDNSGKLIFIQTELADMNNVNFSSSVSGLYTLRITIGQDISEWKIIKE